MAQHPGHARVRAPVRHHVDARVRGLRRESQHDRVAGRGPEHVRPRLVDDREAQDHVHGGGRGVGHGPEGRRGLLHILEHHRAHGHVHLRGREDPPAPGRGHVQEHEGMQAHGRD